MPICSKAFSFTGTAPIPTFPDNGLYPWTPPWPLLTFGLINWCMPWNILVEKYSIIATAHRAHQAWPRKSPVTQSSQSLLKFRQTFSFSRICHKRSGIGTSVVVIEYSHAGIDWVFIEIMRHCMLQSLTEDVARQMERERELQKRFADLQQQKDDLSDLLNQWHRDVQDVTFADWELSKTQVYYVLCK